MAVRALVFDVFGTLVDWRWASPTRSGRAGCRTIPTSWPTGGAPAIGRSSRRSTTAPGPGATSTSCTARRSTTSSPSAAWTRRRAEGRAGLAPPRSLARRPRRPRGAAARAPRGHALQRPRGPARRPRAPRRPALRLRAVGQLARAYKPAPAAYRTAARLLGVAPGELMLVAAHPGASTAPAPPACAARSSTARSSTDRAPSRARIRTPTSRSAAWGSWPSGSAADGPPAAMSPLAHGEPAGAQSWRRSPA